MKALAYHGAQDVRTDHRGVDASIDAVGYEAKGSTTETVLAALKLEDSSGKVLRIGPAILAASSRTSECVPSLGFQ